MVLGTRNTLLYQCHDHGIDMQPILQYYNMQNITISRWRQKLKIFLEGTTIFYGISPMFQTISDNLVRAGPPVSATPFSMHINGPVKRIWLSNQWLSYVFSAMMAQFGKLAGHIPCLETYWHHVLMTGRWAIQHMISNLAARVYSYVIRYTFF